MAKYLDRNLVASFTEEVREYLPAIRAALERMQNEFLHPEAMEEAHRLVHSIKGAAAMAGLPALSHIAYFFEEAIEELASGSLSWTLHTATVLRRTVDLMETYLNETEMGHLHEKPFLSEATASFRRLRKLPESGDEAELARLLGPSGDEPLRFVSGDSAIPSVASIEPPPPIAQESRRPLFDLDALAAAPELPDFPEELEAPPPPAALESTDTEADSPDQLMAFFRSEAEAEIKHLGELYQELQAKRGDPALLSNIQPLVTAMRSATEMVGLTNASTLTGKMGELLDRAAAKKLRLDEAMYELLQYTLEALREEFRGEGGEKTEMALGTYDIVFEDADAPPPAPAPARALHAEAPVLVVEEVSPDLLATFREEAEEHLRLISENLRTLESEPGNMAVLQDVRRSVHTLKGASGMVGLKSLSKLAHRAEDLLDRLYADGLGLSQDLITLFAITADVIHDMTFGDMSDPAAKATLATRSQEIYQVYGALLGETAPEPAEPAPARPGALDTTVPDDLPLDQIPSDLIATFREEADEHIRIIGESLQGLEGDLGNINLMREVRRSVHTLKGASGMVGLKVLSRLAHRMEDLLDRLYDEGKSLTSEMLTLFHATADVIARMAAGDDPPLQRERAGEILQVFATLMGGEAAVEAPSPQSLAAEPAEPVPAEPEVTETPAAEAEPAAEVAAVGAQASSRRGQFVRVPLERLDELVRAVSELLVNRSAFEQHLRGYIREVTELELSLARLRRISGRMDSEFEVSALQGGFGTLAVRGFVSSKLGVPGLDNRAEFDALEFDRYTDFHLMSRDLAETASDISTVGAELSRIRAAFDLSLTRFGRLISETQDKLTNLRLVPLSTLSARLYRTVRVTAGARGKLADLIIDGESVELDKTVLEEMVGPLEHILRNCVDHGIEPPERRLALRKPEKGEVTLKASYEGADVVLEVRDDGRGIDPEIIREAAVRQGFVRDEDAATLTPAELFEFLFLAGFTTAKEVSETSGRGVGMDVVKTTVTQLKGQIKIESTPGQGSRFIIRLPMRLAVVKVLLVRTHRETWAIPLAAITQVLRVDRRDVESVGRRQILEVEAIKYPAASLGDLLGVKAPAEQPQRVPVIMVQSAGRDMAILVDEIIESREVVLKPLGHLLKRVPGVLGATLMGDGRVVLITNPADLVQKLDEREAPRPARTPVITQQISRAYDVMVVDDSISVRRVLSNLIASVGWNPIPAKDGLEALEIIQRSPKRPDVILLDIEMPRMDGYELTATLRGQDAYKHVPIVMLTSRAGEKHRTKAFELGATDYLVKPYQDETLLSVVRRVVKEARSAAFAEPH